MQFHKAGSNREKFASKPLPLETLFCEYGVEKKHARNVARNAVELFDLLAPPYHGLDRSFRELLEVAALVHDIGVTTDPENHHRAGRDILLKHPPAELPSHLRPVVAWTAFLHRKKMTGEKLEKLRKTPFSRMPEGLQAVTLKVAALLRLADSLDYSRRESRLGDARFGEEFAELEIKGSGAGIDAGRMSQKSDLWDLLFEKRLGFRPEKQEAEKTGGLKKSGP